MKKATELVISSVIAAPIVIGLFFGLAVYLAFVGSTLYNWFVVPHFNVAEMPMSVAYGIMLIGTLFRSKYKDHKADFSAILMTPALALGIGYIVKTYFM